MAAHMHRPLRCAPAPPTRRQHPPVSWSVRRLTAAQARGLHNKAAGDAERGHDQEQRARHICGQKSGISLAGAHETRATEFIAPVL